MDIIDDNKASESETEFKISLVLSKLSDFYRQLLWSQAQPHGLSPIQVQLILFIKNHSSALSKVSQLAKEFQMTKATISDSVRVLVDKNLLRKVSEINDKRSFSLHLTTRGVQLANTIESYQGDFHKALSKLGTEKKTNLFKGLFELLDRLNEEGLIPVQRMCFNCSFYHGDKENSHMCSFLKKNLQTTDIRVDCGDFKSK
ncbi:MarR family winged helix-turn-helix transcriptional regulator [Roseivirga sp. E12]|uniref:MarR family winged helix-turn-helix transcriptional regulator n=1 Tax=Roseivirga sp. E12 TaxID=2819237 RepID=UPI001ABC669D|nr:MarR family transcriptional regulator [Roseivirga sp. E12]MBO3698018.1 MarR family transcriptional regulator [Roseivirga sp. E12]